MKADFSPSLNPSHRGREDYRDWVILCRDLQGDMFARFRRQCNQHFQAELFPFAGD